MRVVAGAFGVLLRRAPAALCFLRRHMASAVAPMRVLRDDRRGLPDDRRRSRAAGAPAGTVSQLRRFSKDAGCGTGDAVPARGDRGPGQLRPRSGRTPPRLQAAGPADAETE